MVDKIRRELKKYIRREKKEILSRFFKTGKGQYGEGDIFIGVMVPDIRKVAKNFIHCDYSTFLDLLHSKIHEERLLALLILVQKFERGNDLEKKKIVNLYIKNTKYINNWDLVDLSAPKILGEYFYDKNREVIYKMSESNDLWKKRISMLTTYGFIKKGDFKDTFRIADILLQDEHDLIQKAVGWMLREVGNRDIEQEELFLKSRYKKMGRTMLRYAIEKFPEAKRLKYLKGLV